MNSDGMKDLLRIWETERRKHPFIAFNMDGRSIEDCWENISPNYSGENYSMIIGDIIGSLTKRGVLRKGDSVLDIGCGTGLFDIPISKIADRIVCVDASGGMLRRLKEQCLRQNVSNIETVESSWEDFDTDEKFDIVFSSLCPALNNPESILRMSSYSKRGCVYISSAFHNSGMEIDVWKQIGQEISFKGLDTRFPYRFLKLCGMVPELNFFTSGSEHTFSIDEAKFMLESKIEKYCIVTNDMRKAINEVVNAKADGGIVVEAKNLTLGLLTW